MQPAGWYADPTGRHEWRYWRPGWEELAADGKDEIHDPLRPRWQRYLGIAFIAQLILVPVLGFVLVQQGDKPDSRVGVFQQAGQDPPVISLIYSGCSGEQVTHIALSKSGGKGQLNTVIWSAVGNAAVDDPIEVGKTPDGMTAKKELAAPVGSRGTYVLLVSTNQLANPNTLTFDMADVPTAGALSYHGTYADDDAFRTAALDTTPCGFENVNSRGLLIKVLLAEGLLAVIGVALLLLPRYPGPASPYA